MTNLETGKQLLHVHLSVNSAKSIIVQMYAKLLALSEPKRLNCEIESTTFMFQNELETRLLFLYETCSSLL